LALCIRPATAQDDALTVEILRLGDLSTRQPQAIAFYRSRPNSRGFVGTLSGEPVAVGLGVHFGEAGWVGNIAVHPDHRRRGFGTAMTQAVVAWLHSRGARTVLLTATAEGSRVYERIGFVEDGGVVYGTWTRREVTPEPDAAQVPPAVRTGTLAEAVTVDRRATGEDRSAYIEPFADRIHVVDGGYRFGTPWGPGPVIARSPEAGRALLFDMFRESPNPRIGFPDSNLAAVDAAREAGFTRIAEDIRMRLGPPVQGFDPQAIFCVLSFVCG
jgi:GNAT superfamily N-acetyltransferase